MRTVVSRCYDSFLCKFLASKGLYKDVRVKIIKFAIGPCMYGKRGNIYNFRLCHDHSSVGLSFKCNIKWRLGLDYGSIYITRIGCSRCGSITCGGGECECPFCLWVIALCSSNLNFKDIIRI